MSTITPNPSDCDDCPSECRCGVCEMTAIGAVVSGLLSSSCSNDDSNGCFEWENLGSALNKNYELVLHDGQWRQLFGTIADHDDAGIKIFNSEYSGIQCEDTVYYDEAYVWKVSGELACSACALPGGQTGKLWSGWIAFHVQHFYAPGDKSFWQNSQSPASPWGWECANLNFTAIETQDCTPPDGCTGKVVYSNSDNLRLVTVSNDPVEMCDCTDASSEATVEMYPIGSSESCEE